MSPCFPGLHGTDYTANDGKEESPGLTEYAIMSPCFSGLPGTDSTTACEEDVSQSFTEYDIISSGSNGSY